MADINANRQGNPLDSSNREQVQAEKTLQQIRDENTKKWADLKASLILQLGQKERGELNAIQAITTKLAEDANKLKEDLLEKYTVKYAAEIKSGAKTEEDIRKQVADQVATYIKNANYKRIHEEAEEELKQKLDLVDFERKADSEHRENMKKIYADNFAATKKRLAEETKAGKISKKEAKEQLKEAQKQTAKDMRDNGASELEIMQATGQITGAAVKEAVTGKETTSAIANTLINGLKQMFDNTIQTYGQYQNKINTRIQGTGTSWRRIEENLKYGIGTTPWLKTQQMMDNVVKATEQGIAFNIEQRAFLGTIKDSIAATFDAFDSNLARIIRLQQADSTAARLGLEASLTKYFNANYEDTSYLNSAFDIVSQNLIEATSLMSAEDSVAFEYQVQKWLGSLSSVGFSDTAVGAISQALGALGSGDVSSLAGNSTMQNLLVMAASRAGLNYSDLLINGLNESNTNKLLESMVLYLQEIANSDNKVVKSQYAQIFGMSVSDLSAVKNLIGDVNSIAQQSLNYSGAINELYNQMSLANLASRVGIGGMLQNMMDNVNYSIASSIAANPVTYALWEITSMIEDLTGGIALPTFSVMGNMVDLNTTVTNLMRAGIVGISSLGAIGQLISGIASTAVPATMLGKLALLTGDSSLGGKFGARTTARGSGLNRKVKLTEETSSSTFVGNTAGDDYYESSTASANDQVDTTMQAKKEENKDITLNDMHQYLLQVFDPKITEIERLVAILAGYEVGKVQRDTSWNTYDLDQNNPLPFMDNKYGVTKVNISENPKYQINNSALISSINENVSSILSVLKGTLNVNMVNYPTPAGTSGMGGITG